MRNRKLLSFVTALLVIAVTARICARMSYLQNEINLCVEPEVTNAVEIGAVQAISHTDFIRSEYAESVKTAHVGTITVVKVVEQYFFLPEIPLSKNLQTVMQDACIEYKVPYSLALAVAEIESAFDVDAVNSSCVGLMQINECNYDWLRKLGVESTEQEGNVVAGVLMIGQLLEKYQDTHKALMAYNCGETGASRLWKQGYLTNTFSRKVMNATDKWKQAIDNQ